MSRHFAQTVVRLRAPTVVDRYSSVQRDWANAAPFEIAGVNLQPAASPSSSSEDTDDRQVTVTGWHLCTPPGMDIDLLETDRVSYAGMTLQVVGKVGRWEVAGRVHHVEATLTEVS